MFEDFSGKDDLQPIFIRFCILAVFLGFAVSAMQFNDKLTTSFKTAFPVPLAAMAANVALELAIMPAFAGAPSFFDSSDPKSIEFWMVPVFFLGAGLVFALVARFGCAVGIGFRQGVEKALLGSGNRLITTNTPQPSSLSNPEIRIARISAFAAISVSILGNMTVLITTYFAY